jgi:hypothetical protein
MRSETGLCGVGNISFLLCFVASSKILDTHCSVRVARSEGIEREKRQNANRDL